MTKSRRPSGAVLFRVIAAGRLRGLAIGVKKQPEADGREHFSGVYLRRLERLFAGHRPKAGGWSYLSRSIDQKSEALWPERFFRLYLRALERLFAQYRSKAKGRPEPYFFGVLQQAAWGASRSVGKGSWRLSDLNVFSGYISEDWWDFLRGINQKPKVVWSCTFSGHRSRPLEWFSAEN